MRNINHTDETQAEALALKITELSGNMDRETQRQLDREAFLAGFSDLEDAKLCLCDLGLLAF